MFLFFCLFVCRKCCYYFVCLSVCICKCSYSFVCFSVWVSVSNVLFVCVGGWVCRAGLRSYAVQLDECLQAPLYYLVSCKKLKIFYTQTFSYLGNNRITKRYQNKLF